VTRGVGLNEKIGERESVNLNRESESFVGALIKMNVDGGIGNRFTRGNGGGVGSDDGRIKDEGGR
jgi:hypothetical protein